MKGGSPPSLPPGLGDKLPLHALAVRPTYDDDTSTPFPKSKDRRPDCCMTARGEGRGGGRGEEQIGWTGKPTSLFRSSFRIFLLLRLSIQENTRRAARRKPEAKTSWPCPKSQLQFHPPPPFETCASIAFLSCIFRQIP